MRRTLLIVDDHAAFRASARALLEKQGFDVIGEAATGASGLEAAADLAPDVVLVDVQLPDLDGFAVAARLAQVAAASAVVLTSSRDASEFGPLVRESGARGFLPKSEISASRIGALLD